MPDKEGAGRSIWRYGKDYSELVQTAGHRYRWGAHVTKTTCTTFSGKGAPRFDQKKPGLL